MYGEEMEAHNKYNQRQLNWTTRVVVGNNKRFGEGWELFARSPKSWKTKYSNGILT